MTTKNPPDKAEVLMQELMSQVQPGVIGNALATRFFGGTCVQVEKRTACKETATGRREIISFHWFLECRRSSKSKVHKVISRSESGAT